MVPEGLGTTRMGTDNLERIQTLWWRNSSAHQVVEKFTVLARLELAGVAGQTLGHTPEHRQESGHGRSVTWMCVGNPCDPMSRRTLKHVVQAGLWFPCWEGCRKVISRPCLYLEEWPCSGLEPVQVPSVLTPTPPASSPCLLCPSSSLCWESLTSGPLERRKRNSFVYYRALITGCITRWLAMN